LDFFQPCDVERTNKLALNTLIKLKPRPFLFNFNRFLLSILLILLALSYLILLILSFFVLLQYTRVHPDTFVEGQIENLVLYFLKVAPCSSFENILPARLL